MVFNSVWTLDDNAIFFVLHKNILQGVKYYEKEGDGVLVTVIIYL